jgi:hypothetical protein
VSVRYAVLALLGEGPRYGLRLRGEFEAVRTLPHLSSPPRDELVMKVLVALRVPSADAHAVIQAHRRYLVELVQQWTRIKEHDAEDDLNMLLRSTPSCSGLTRWSGGWTPQKPASGARQPTGTKTWADRASPQDKIRAPLPRRRRREVRTRR